MPLVPHDLLPKAQFQFVKSASFDSGLVQLPTDEPGKGIVV